MSAWTKKIAATAMRWGIPRMTQAVRTESIVTEPPETTGIVPAPVAFDALAGLNARRRPATVEKTGS